jgi:hypothetical protein
VYKNIKFIGGPWHNKCRTVDVYQNPLVVEIPKFPNPRMDFRDALGATTNILLKKIIYKPIYIGSKPLTYKGCEVYAIDSMIDKSKLIRRWSRRDENIYKPNEWDRDFKKYRF